MAVAIPLAMQVGGMIAGKIAAKKAQKNAMKRTAEEQASLTGAQGAAGSLSGMGQSLFDRASPLFNQASQLMQQGGQFTQQGAGIINQGNALANTGAGNLGQTASYYSKLLSGDRAAQQQALAAPRAGITGIYRGAEQNLERSGVRGAARDVAQADLGRQRASQLAGLTTGVQGAAAEGLAGVGAQQGSLGLGQGGLGVNVAQLGQGLYGTAGSLYGTAGNIAATGMQGVHGAGSLYSNLLGQAGQHRAQAEATGERAGQAIGGLIAGAGNAIGGYFGGKGIAALPTKTSYGPGQGGIPSTGFQLPRGNTGIGGGVLRSYQQPTRPPWQTQVMY